MNRLASFLLFCSFVSHGNILANKIKESSPSGTKIDVQEIAGKIDDFIAAKYGDFQVEPYGEITDETFVRRIYLQIAGRIPSPDERKLFMDSDSREKRSELIRELLQSEAYVSHHFNFWADVLRVNDDLNGNSKTAVAAYKLWIKNALRQNLPYDEFVRELVSARGMIWENGAVGYYQRDRGMPLDNMSNTVRIFLGTRLECAQCHNHPFDKWTQMDYFKMAAFSYGMSAGRYDTDNRKQVTVMLKEEKQKAFEEAVGIEGFRAILSEEKLERLLESRKLNRIEGKYGLTKEEFAEKARKGIQALKGMPDDERDIKAALGELYDPIQYIASSESEKTLKLPHDYQYSDAEPESSVSFATMFGENVDGPIGGSLIDAYADWMTGPENPTFTKVIANRLWKKAFGAGLIEPVDELTELSKPSHPELLAFLEHLMRDLNYDMRAYLEVLYNTGTFQREAHREELAAGMPYHFAGPVLRRMTAEQVWDSLVTMMIERPDHYMPDLEKDLSSLERQKQIYESLEGKAPEEFMAIARKAASLTRDSLEKQEKLRKEVAEARQADDYRLAKNLSSQLGKIRNETRRGLADMAYTEVEEGKDVAFVMDHFGLTDDFMETVYSDQPKTNKKPDRRKLKSEMSKSEIAVLRKEMQEKREMQANQARKKRNRGEASLAKDIVRASEMETPARRGHFLREFGQSDREIIENANDSASVPQVLALMNGPILEMLMDYNSVLRGEIEKYDTPTEKVEAAYTALLARTPDDQEKALLLTEMEAGDPDQGLENILWALLNTSKFLFVE